MRISWKALGALLLLAACAAPRRDDALVPEPLPTPAPARVAAEPRESSLAIASLQPGVRAFVDGADAGPLPASVRVEPGVHVVRLEGPRYETREIRVTVAPGESTKLHETLAVTRGKATLVLLTPGAKVELVSGNDRRAVLQLPIAIEIGPDKEWTIEATKPGLRPYRRTIRFDDGVAEKTFEIELAP